jgi:cell division cycle protein 37
LVKDGESFELDEYTQFKADHKSLLDAFTEADWERSHELLMSRGDILMDDYTNSYFLLGALDAEMKGDKALVKKLARQGQIISQIHQLAKPMNRPPRDLVPRFFEKFTAGHAQAAFEEGVTHFMQQFAKRAIDKKAEEAAAAEEAEEAGEQEGEAVSLVEAMYQMTPEERMGPGGLDPVEVFESLPEVLQECFRTSDVERLKQVAKTMVDFDKHFKRCVDAGLWQSGK